MDYSTENRGTLFAETDKKSDKSPDYTGKLDVNGKEYRLAGWKRQSKTGKTFLSLAISEPTLRDSPRDIVAEMPLDGEPISMDNIPF